MTAKNFTVSLSKVAATIVYKLVLLLLFMPVEIVYHAIDFIGNVFSSCIEFTVILSGIVERISKFFAEQLYAAPKRNNSIHF